MFLEQFEKFDKICIQCHDSPDADAIGSGFGLYSYFRDLGKEVQLIYSGIHKITKPCLQIMVDRLQIPIRYVEELPPCDILIMVDCQYQGGNSTVFPAEQVAMVDHHPACGDIDSRCCIWNQYGSCSTVVWKLLQQMGYDVNEKINVATALYFGLFTDTGHLSEIFHEADKEMRDSLVVDRDIMEEMLNSNLSREELEIAGEALTDYYYDSDYRFAVLRTRPCDPNLLGVISDLVNQVSTIDVCIVYHEVAIGYKLSLRSSLRNWEANDMAQIVTEGIGSGGGHTNKAGGFIMKKMFRARYGEADFERVICARLQDCMRQLERE